MGPRLAVIFGMLTTFEVGPHVGRVCYCTEVQSKRSVTVECPEEKLAVRFETDDGLKIGSWVRIRGLTRVDASVKADGTPAERGEYYHAPHDGTSKSEWTFKQLTSAESVLVAPPEFATAMRGAMLCLRRHLDSWEKNLDLSKWEETSSVLKSVQAMVQQEVDERKPLLVVAVQITDV